MNRKTKIIIGAIAVVAIVIVVGARFAWSKFHVALPDYPSIEKAVWLEQNWQPAQREWYHHADQGTLTFGIPYEWFVALEQPTISLGAPGLFSDPVYLDRFGFIPGTTEGASRPLPVGFAHGGPMRDVDGAPFLNPRSKESMTGIGLTCAACHTGRFTYRNTTVLIDGAPALTDLGKLRQALGLSVLFTRIIPGRFERFAERVLKPGGGPEATKVLREQLDLVWTRRFSKVRALDAKVAPHSVVEGFGRLDALNRIGNAVFGLALRRDENYVGTSAPVHYPRIWDASWFDWVQYNGAIEQPMVRNAGEAMGVNAPLNLIDPTRLYESDVQVGTLFAMEAMLAGKPQPTETHRFNGLSSPTWPKDILPPIDPALAARGAELYGQLCQGCHLPPVGSKEFWESDRWLPPNKAGERYLRVEMIRLSHIGTDPAQAVDMQRRTVTFPDDLKLESDEFGLALGELVEKTVDHWYDSQQPKVPPERREEMNGYRRNGIQAVQKYKVRPLNGVWATPPYLHNGSVPNLYALLSPLAERPKEFWLGHREYDPVNVGYQSTEELPGGFRFDTTIRGNHNTGHEFDDPPMDGTPREGIIGRRLTPEERRALIEFIKTQ